MLFVDIRKYHVRFYLCDLAKMGCLVGCQKRILKGFYKYGHFLASHPAPFLVLPLLACAGMAVGFMWMEPETDVGEYMRNSTCIMGHGIESLLKLPPMKSSSSQI